MRSQKMLENMKQIIGNRRKGRMLDSPFRTPEHIEYGDALHAQGEATSPITDAALDDPRSTPTPDPDAPATSLTQGMPTLDDERQAKRARQEPDEGADLLWEKGEKPPLSKPVKGTDLEPWNDGFYGLLQAADYPTGDPDDNLIQGEDDLPPAARRCPKAVRRLIRNAHRNLGHPSCQVPRQP